MNLQELTDESITIETSRGQFKVTPSYFSAIDGWEMKKQLKFYLESEEDDKGAALRMKFTMRVLSYANFIDDGKPISLNRVDVVNNSLESWVNVQAVFDAVLKYNGIEPEMAEEVDRQALKVGAMMGQGFWTQCVAMMEPLIETYVKGEADKASKGA
jgi:hypothetical protein